MTRHSIKFAFIHSGYSTLVSAIGVTIKVLPMEETSITQQHNHTKTIK